MAKDEAERQVDEFSRHTRRTRVPRAIKSVPPAASRCPKRECIRKPGGSVLRLSSFMIERFLSPQRFDRAIVSCHFQIADTAIGDPPLVPAKSTEPSQYAGVNPAEYANSCEGSDVEHSRQC